MKSGYYPDLKFLPVNQILAKMKTLVLMPLLIITLLYFAECAVLLRDRDPFEMFLQNGRAPIGNTNNERVKRSPDVEDYDDGDDDRKKRSPYSDGEDDDERKRQSVDESGEIDGIRKKRSPDSDVNDDDDRRKRSVNDDDDDEDDVRKKRSPASYDVDNDNYWI